MTTTNPSYPIVSFGLDDTNIKNNISSINGNAGDQSVFSFSNSLDFAEGKKTIVPYATFEPDFWVLDGSYHFMPTNPNIGFMWSTLSDPGGDFPLGGSDTLITFTAVKNLSGITIYFDVPSNNWCSSMEIDFYDGSSVLIYGSGFLSPTSTSFTLTHAVSGCKYIHIVFHNTNNPNRFLRMTAIDFGTVTYLESDKIKSAKITEEFSPISETLTANSLELDLLLDSSDFSVVNPSPTYAALTTEGMPFRVYEVVDNVSNLMGVFFLDTWDNGNATDKVIKFNCLDIMALAAKMPFYGWVENVYAFSTIMTYVLGYSNIPYQADSTTNGYSLLNSILIPALSYLEPSSVRDFIQKIAMALRSGVTTRNGYVYFNSRPASTLPAYLTDGSQDYTIALSQEKITKVSLLPIVTGVRFIRNFLNGTPGGSGSVTAYSASLAVGDYVIPFDEMRAGIISITGATDKAPSTWTVNGAWSYEVHVSSPGTVTITDWGKILDDVSNKYMSKTTLIAITSANVSKYAEIDASIIGNATFDANLDTGQAQWLADYFSTRYFQDATVYGIIVHAADIVKIASTNGKYILGTIESATINLVGLRSDIRVVGKVL